MTSLLSFRCTPCVHPSTRSARNGSHQTVRVRLFSYPTGVVSRGNDQRRELVNSSVTTITESMRVRMRTRDNSRNRRRLFVAALALTPISSLCCQVSRLPHLFAHWVVLS